MSRSLISVDLIGADIIDDFADATSKRKFSVTRHIVAGYRRLHMFLLGTKKIQSVILPFDNVINLPCDFMMINKVGVRRFGCIAILSMARDVNRQSYNDTDTCDYLNSVWSGGYSGGGATFSNAWGYGNYYGELYGMGRTIINNGTYSIDQSQGILYLGSNIPPDAEIIIEYTGNGVTDGLKVVPMEMKECLEFYAKWKYYADKNPSMSNTNYILFKKEYNILKSYYQHRTPLEIAQATNESISPSNF